LQEDSVQYKSDNEKLQQKIESLQQAMKEEAEILAKKASN
jgi:hypothetical protein